MTIPPIASEAAASSCPDWMTDETMAAAVTGEFLPNAESIKHMAAEVLRLRRELAELSKKHGWAVGDRDRLSERQRQDTAEIVGMLREAGVIVGSRTKGPAMVAPDAAFEPMTIPKLVRALLDQLGRQCKEKETLRHTGDNRIVTISYNIGMRGLESDLNKAGIAAHGGHLPSRMRDALAELDRLRKENDVLRREEKNADALIGHVRRCMISVDREQSPYDLGSRVAAATAELLRLRRESKRERADKAEAKLAEVARILGGTGDVVQRARTVASKLRTTEADRGEMLQNLAGISTIACAESLDHYSPGQPWERAALGDVVKLVRKLQEARAERDLSDAARALMDKELDTARPAKEALVAAHDELNAVARILGLTGQQALVARAEAVVRERDKAWSDLAKARAERNEFAALQVEGFLDWAYRPGAKWTRDTLHLAAKARAEDLRAMATGGVVDGAAAREAMAAGSWCGTGQQEMPPLHFKFDPKQYAKDFVHRSITLATPVRTPQIPSTEALADIAYCRRNPTLQEARLMAGELFDQRRAVLPLRFDDGRVLSVGSIAGSAHPDAQIDGFPAELTLAMGGMRCRYVRMDTAQRKAAENQQRFSLGTSFHCAVQGATERAVPDSALSDLCAAVRILGAAVEAELLGRA